MRQRLEFSCSLCARFPLDHLAALRDNIDLTIILEIFGVFCHDALEVGCEHLSPVVLTRKIDWLM